MQSRHDKYAYSFQGSPSVNIRLSGPIAINTSSASTIKRSRRSSKQTSGNAR